MNFYEQGGKLYAIFELNRNIFNYLELLPSQLKENSWNHLTITAGNETLIEPSIPAYASQFLTIRWFPLFFAADPLGIQGRKIYSQGNDGCSQVLQLALFLFSLSFEMFDLFLENSSILTVTSTQCLYGFSFKFSSQHDQINQDVSFNFFSVLQKPFFNFGCGT